MVFIRNFLSVFFFCLFDVVDEFLNCAEEADISAKLPADEYGGNRREQTNDDHRQIGKIAVNCHGAEADHCIGTELMAGVELTGYQQ